MTLRRFKDIVALQTEDGTYLGFHTRNLEVAQLEPEVWKALTALTDSQPLSEHQNEIMNELSLWSDSVNSDTQDAPSSSQVRFLSINVTQICNLKCTYCGAGGDGTYGSTQAKLELNQALPQIRWFMDQLPKGAVFYLRFLGGEPLLYPEAIATVARYAQELAHERGLQVQFHLTTNATYVTESVANLLAELHCHIVVSLDGPPEINDRTRPSQGGRGASEKTLRGLNELIRVRDKLGRLACNSVFGAHNLDVQKTYEFLKSFAFDGYGLNIAASERDGEFNQQFIENVVSLADELYRQGGEEGVRKLPDFAAIFETLETQTRVLNHCGAGKSLLQMDTKGDLYACNWLMNNPSEKLGSAPKIDQDAVEKYRPSLIELNNCQTCWARYMCGGGCLFINQVKTGDKHKKDVHFCQRMRSFVAKGIELFAKAKNHEPGGTHEVYQNN